MKNDLTPFQPKLLNRRVSSDLVHPKSKCGSAHESFWTEMLWICQQLHRNDIFIHLVLNNKKLNPDTAPLKIVLLSQQISFDILYLNPLKISQHWFWLKPPNICIPLNHFIISNLTIRQIILPALNSFDPVQNVHMSRYACEARNHIIHILWMPYCWWWQGTPGEIHKVEGIKITFLGREFSIQ